LLRRPHQPPSQPNQSSATILTPQLLAPLTYYVARTNRPVNQTNRHPQFSRPSYSLHLHPTSPAPTAQSTKPIVSHNSHAPVTRSTYTLRRPHQPPSQPNQSSATILTPQLLAPLTYYVARTNRPVNQTNRQPQFSRPSYSLHLHPTSPAPTAQSTKPIVSHNSHAPVTRSTYIRRPHAQSTKPIVPQFSRPSYHLHTTSPQPSQPNQSSATILTPQLLAPLTYYVARTNRPVNQTNRQPQFSRPSYSLHLHPTSPAPTAQSTKPIVSHNSHAPVTRSTYTLRRPHQPPSQPNQSSATILTPQLLAPLTYYVARTNRPANQTKRTISPSSPTNVTYKLRRPTLSVNSNFIGKRKKHKHTSVSLARTETVFTTSPFTSRHLSSTDITQSVQSTIS
jgi:hypothetical protein